MRLLALLLTLAACGDKIRILSPDAGPADAAAVVPDARPDAARPGPDAAAPCPSFTTDGVRCTRTCDYGLQTCCGRRIPTETCQCLAGFFDCRPVTCASPCPGADAGVDAGPGPLDAAAPSD